MVPRRVNFRIQRVLVRTHIYSLTSSCKQVDGEVTQEFLKPQSQDLIHQKEEIFRCLKHSHYFSHEVLQKRKSRPTTPPSLTWLARMQHHTSTFISPEAQGGITGEGITGSCTEVRSVSVVTVWVPFFLNNWTVASTCFTFVTEHLVPSLYPSLRGVLVTWPLNTQQMV